MRSLARRVRREAAARLFISEASIKTHLQHVFFEKLGVRDRAAAVGEDSRRVDLARRLRPDISLVDVRMPASGVGERVRDGYLPMLDDAASRMFSTAAARSM